MKFAKVMFLQVSVCPQGGGGHAWLLGGMHGCSRGACVVAPGGGMRGCFWGVMHGCSGGVCIVAPGWGACMVAPGGMHGCSGGACVVASRGVCMVALGGHVWLLWRGVHGCSGGACVVAPGGRAWLLGGMRGCSGGACVVAWGCVRGFFYEIRSMSGQYASYWNAFLFIKILQVIPQKSL